MIIWHGPHAMEKRSEKYGTYADKFKHIWSYGPIVEMNNVLP
jgi:hypothetical protein